MTEFVWSGRGPVPSEPPAKPVTPLEVYLSIATHFGLVQPGEQLDGRLIDAFAVLVERCASIGDQYETPAGNAGERIRSALFHE